MDEQRTKYVAKKIHLGALKDEEKRAVLQESSILKTLRHPHIV